MKFYVSTYTEGFFNEGPNGSKGIYLCEYNEEKNEFNVLNSFSNSVNPSFIKLNNDHNCLFVACEKLPPSRIDNYLVDNNYNLTFNSSVTLDYRSCCYMSVNDQNQFVAVANYGSGEVFTYGFDDNFKYIGLTSSNRNEDSEIGPNADRQELPHAHSVRLIEANNLYVSCDLGCDKISFYSYSKAGNFIKVKEIKTPAGYGPRHTINSSDGKYLYVTCELKNRILFYEYVNDEYLLKGDYDSLPDDYKGENTCADIHISEDEKYIFISNRGSDTIGQFEINLDGSLKLVKFVSCNGKGPRNFAITNDYLICGNQDSNDCSILEIKNGLLTGNVLCKKEFISPVCIEKI